MEGVIFTGIQASGKSTFFQRFFSKTHIRISLDMLRTRHRESILVNACIEAKQPFVIDNTNPSVADRRRYIVILQDNGFEIKGYYFRSNISECSGRLSKIAQNPSITTHNKKDYRECHNFLIIKVIYTHLGGIKMVGGES